MTAGNNRYEIFISYSRTDNELPPGAPPDAKGWVTALRDGILVDHRRFSTEPLRIFFDTDAIKDMDDWRHRILGALRSSSILLICLSPDYLKSDYCRWEWEEYVQRQVHQLMGSESIATVYFVEVPGSNPDVNARWLEDICRDNYTDIRPWFPEGTNALQREEVQKRMAKLGESLWERIRRARRAEAAPGNLRRQNPYFVGRSEELRRLHEELGTGAVGVVTAVHGLGGQGKTELAVAYAHGWADCYPAGLWAIGAEGKREILPCIGELAWDANLGFTPTDAQRNDPVLLGRGVLAHLEQRVAAVRESDPDKGTAALILLDNVSDPALLSPSELATLPRADWLRIVVTTRLPVAPVKHSLATLAVDSLDETSALALLRDHQLPRDANGNIVDDPKDGVPGFASQAEEDAAREVVRALGCFTLAVEQVAVFLGLHPEIAPSAFLAGLLKKGLPSAGTLSARDPVVAAQMLTQSKQLDLILEATLSSLDVPARTALNFAALLPPDTVPWAWLRDLTVERHPEIAAHAPDEPDPWLEIRRRLTGQRLLTPSDHPQVARLHRMVAAHVNGTAEPWVAERLESLLGSRANFIYGTQATPLDWELDALLAAVPFWLADHSAHDLANAANFLSEKVVKYRTLPAASSLLASSHAVNRRLSDIDPANAEWQRNLWVSLVRIGDLAVAQGDLAAASRYFTDGLYIAQHLADSDPVNAESQVDLFVSLERHGNLTMTQGDLPAALRYFTEGLCIAQRLADIDPTNAERQHSLWVSLAKLGDLAVTQGDLAAGVRYLTDGLCIAQHLADSDPANAAWQRVLSVSLERLGNLAQAQGDFPAGLRYFTDSLRITQRLADSDSANAEWQRDLSVSLNKLGDLARVQGDLATALCYFTDCHRIRQRLTDSDPTNAAWQCDLSVSLERLGDLAVAQGDLPAALRCFSDCLRIRQRFADSDPANTEWQCNLTVSLNRLGDLALTRGDLTEALRYFTDGLRITQRLADSDPANAKWQYDLGILVERLGSVAVAQGRLDDAKGCFQRKNKIIQCLVDSEPANAAWQRDLSVSLIGLGDLAVRQGDLSAASGYFSDCLRITQRLADSAPAHAVWQRDLSVSLERLGDLAVAQGDLPAALHYFTDGLRIAQSFADSDPANAAWQHDLWVSYWNLADLSEKSDKAEAAADWWRKAYDTLDGMRQRGLFMSPQDEQHLVQLRLKIGS